MIRTQWFTDSPATCGAWEVQSFIPDLTLFSYWDGRKWGYVANSPKIAYLYRKKPSGYQGRVWRGLADKPKAKGE